MKRGKFGAWLAVTLGVAYFLAPLVATFEFSPRRMRSENSKVATSGARKYATPTNTASQAPNLPLFI